MKVPLSVTRLHPGHSVLTGRGIGEGCMGEMPHWLFSGIPLFWNNIFEPGESAALN